MKYVFDMLKRENGYFRKKLSIYKNENDKIETNIMRGKRWNEIAIYNSKRRDA